MSKQYHIFISSTLDDLKGERQELARVIWEMGHIPVALDLFDINDAGAQRLIKKNIEACDYFLSITAHKWDVSAEGKSWIEAEYTHGVNAGIPVIALILGETARWKASKKDTDPVLIAAMEAFNRKLRSHPHAFWTNSLELRQKSRELLTQEMNLNSRHGWVPGDQATAPSVANELSRLSGENQTLRQRLILDGRDGIAALQGQMKRTLGMLAVNRVSLSFYYAPGENWENTIKCRYLRLFKLLVPELYLGKTTAELSRFLGSILNPDLERTVRKDYPTPSNTIKKIMADLHLLGLVQYAGGGEDELWEITAYGKELFAAYRLRQFERGLVKKE
jgi:hypothetical protein